MIVRQVIHDVGLVPSTMNVGPQSHATCVEVNGLRNSMGHEGLSLPGQGAAGLILNDTCLKEVAFFLQVNHFAHPREWIFLIGE